MLLKVMAGDKFNIRANAWWTGSSSGSNTSPLTSIVSALISSAPGLSGGKLNPADLTSTILDPQVNAFLSSQPAISGKPKAYLNWILFDEQFKYVSGSSGAEAVDASGVFKTFNKTNMPVDKNGYLYIYVSNETSYDVFFDNLQVTHVRGSLLEESHYYPWGLVIGGISSKALEFGNPENKYKYNGIEKEGDLGLEVYDAQLRELDGQTGRWWQVDPITEGYEDISPYASMYNNPLRYSDPLGNEGQDCCWDAIVGAVEDLLISSSGVVNGMLNTMSGGLISTDPFGLRNRMGGEKLDLYNRSTFIGQLGTALAPAAGKSPSAPPTPTPMLQPVGGPPVPVPVPVAAPLPPLVMPLAKTQSDKPGTDQSQGKKTDHGGGKNAQHSNQKARESARQRYERVKAEYEQIKRKPNKSKEDKAQLEQLEKQVKHEKKKMDNTGENHSQKAKGSN